MLHIRHTRQADVTAADKNAAVFKAVIRIITDGIAEVVAVERAVDKVILAVELAHGTCFAERLLFIGRSLCPISREHPDIAKPVSGDHREHVTGVDFKEHRPVFRRLGSVKQDRVPAEGKTGIEIQPPVRIHQAAGVKLERLISFADRGTVFIMDVAEEFIFPGRFIADSHRDHLGAAHEIIQIISAVRAHDHIRRSEAVCQTHFRCSGILLSLEDAAVVCPVAEIVHRGRPADIVSQAEIEAVEKVMRAVNIYSAVNDMRLGIRHIFPARQIGVKSLFFHVYSPSR